MIMCYGLPEGSHTACTACPLGSTLYHNIIMVYILFNRYISAQLLEPQGSV